MAEILRYVDTGAAAGGNGTTSGTADTGNQAYQSLSQWEAAEQTDLDTANNTHTVHCNRTNSGGMDTTTTTILGWTTSATDFITIIGDDFPADGIFDNTKYVLHNNDSSILFLELREDYITVTNIQFQITETSTNSRYGLVLNDASVDIRIDSCIINGVCSGTGVVYAIFVTNASAAVNIFNTTICNIVSGADSDFRAVRITSGVLNIYNCTLYGNYIAIDRGGGTAIAINCLVFNNTDDFGGTVGATYCASDDSQAGTGNFQITQTASDYAALVTDAPNGDFSVKDASSELYQTGNGATPKGVFTDDVIGTTRDAVDLNWDIGAYELIVSGGDAGIMTLNTNFWGATYNG